MRSVNIIKYSIKIQVRTNFFAKILIRLWHNIFVSFEFLGKIFLCQKFEFCGNIFAKKSIFGLWLCQINVWEKNFGQPSMMWQSRTSQNKGSLRGTVRRAGVLNQSSGTSLNTNTGSIGAAQAHLHAHAHESYAGQNFRLSEAETQNTQSNLSVAYASHYLRQSWLHQYSLKPDRRYLEIQGLAYAFHLGLNQNINVTITSNFGNFHTVQKHGQNHPN